MIITLMSNSLKTYIFIKKKNEALWFNQNKLNAKKVFIDVDKIIIYLTWIKTEFSIKTQKQSRIVYHHIESNNGIYYFQTKSTSVNRWWFGFSEIIDDSKIKQVQIRWFVGNLPVTWHSFIHVKFNMTSN